MKRADSPYWVTVSMESEEAEEAVRTALSACQMVHEWAMAEMRGKWIDSPNHKVESNDMVQAMTEFIHRLNIQQYAQRYSFVTTVARAVSLFNQSITVQPFDEGTGAQVFFPSPTIPDNYRLLEIQSRAVWRRYMKEFDRFSTHYGSMFLEGDWRAVVGTQAFDMRISQNAYPYLIYSASIREVSGGWQAHFNLHKLETRTGKKRVKQSWQ